MQGKLAATARLAAAKFCDERRNCRAAAGLPAEEDDVGTIPYAAAGGKPICCIAIKLKASGSLLNS